MMIDRLKYLFLGLVTIAIAVGIFVLLSYHPPVTVISVNPPVPTSTALPTNTPGPLHIYVIGGVATPFVVYTLPQGSRVADAIDAAGGFSPDADRARINLAQLLADGQQINVPVLASSVENGTPGQSTSNTAATPPPVVNPVPVISGGPSASDATAEATKSGGKAKSTPSGVIHVNTATLDELQQLPGVGAATAQAIIDYRTKNGPFKSLDDLVKVPRLGQKTVEKWQGLVSFD